ELSGSGVRPGRETVARSTYGFNVGIVAGGFERLTQPPNVDIDGAFFNKDVIAPDLVQQLRPGKYPFGVGHEEVQQAEFCGAHRQRLAGARYSVRDGIQS